MVKRLFLGMVLLPALTAGTAHPALAKSPRIINDNDTVTLQGNVHPRARPEFDRGPSDPQLPMERMILTLQRSPAQQADLDKLLAGQQDPTSANYHRWLSPEEFAGKFSPAADDLAAVTGWLTSQGFSVEQAPRGRSSLVFSGTAAKVERAFHTRMRNFLVDGELRHANAQDPALPRGLADLVAGVVSLHNFPYKQMNSGARPAPRDISLPGYTSGGSHYLSPADFATIYNVNPLYAAGIDGTGQSIAIVGRTHPSSTNWTTFRSSMGLPANPVQVILNGADPGDLGAGEDGEADLDVEWSGAVAKGATVKFVVSKSGTSDGVALSAQYAVNNDLAPVISTSFGLCEAILGASGTSFYTSLWQQAAAQGITSFVSSGDSGAAGCSASDAASGSGLGVNGLGSSPYNVAVGGTQFSDAAGGFWSATNGSSYSSALSYIPETAWNESGSVSGGTQLWSSGGGASLYYGQPSWQVAPGVPANGKRNVPDVSLSAASHDGYLVRSQGKLSAFGGTSAASPSFAGLMALVVQKTGERQGNANVRFYQLGNAQYASGGAAVFHDPTSGDNSVPGVTGFSCGVGYDQATGLGSVDANALAGNWVAPPAPLAIVSANPLLNGTLGIGFATTLVATGGTPPYNWSVIAGSLAPGIVLTSGTGGVSGTPTATGVYSATLQLSDSAGGSSSREFTQAVSGAPCANWPVRGLGAPTLFYPDFATAYPLIAAGNDIQLQALDFSADFLLDREIAVSLSGGYDCGYTGNGSATGVLGKLRVKSGTVAIDKLRFK